MRRLLYSFLATTFLGTMVGCAHIAGVCDCFGDPDPCGRGPGGNGGCAGCNGNGCAGTGTVEQNIPAPALSDSLPMPSKKR